MRTPRDPYNHARRARPGAGRMSQSSARSRRPQLIADAVIANYIHDISVRHRRPAVTRSTIADRLAALAR